MSKLKYQWSTHPSFPPQRAEWRTILQMHGRETMKLYCSHLSKSFFIKKLGQPGRAWGRGQTRCLQCCDCPDVSLSHKHKVGDLDLRGGFSELSTHSTRALAKSARVFWWHGLNVLSKIPGRADICIEWLSGNLWDDWEEVLSPEASWFSPLAMFRCRLRGYRNWIRSLRTRNRYVRKSGNNWLFIAYS